MYKYLFFYIHSVFILLLYRQQCVFVWWKFWSEECVCMYESERVKVSVCEREKYNRKRSEYPSKVKSSTCVVRKQISSLKYRAKIESTHFDLWRVITSMSKFNVPIFSDAHRHTHWKRQESGRECGRCLMCSS